MKYKEGDKIPASTFKQHLKQQEQWRIARDNK